MKRKLIDAIAGRMWLQSFFQSLYSAAVYGMNYGGGGDFTKSGERYVAQYIRKKLEVVKASLVLFDVGANKGGYAADLASAMKGLDFTIYSFEPSPIIFELLKKNSVAIPSIHPYNVGFSDRPEVLKLYKTADFSGLSSVYKRRLDHFNMYMNTSEDVQLARLDDFCAAESIESIDFLKMDVEGHELRCLVGAQKMLQNKKIRFIQFEFGGCNIDSRTYFQDFWYLMHKDFYIYRIVKNGLVPIRQYNERLEIFKNINYLAELK